MGVDISIVEQVKKTKEDFWETVPENNKRKDYFGRDYDLFSFLAGVRGSFEPFKRCDEWKNVVLDSRLEEYKNDCFYGFNSYTLKELKRAAKKYKIMQSSQELDFCSNCEKEFKKENKHINKTHPFFKQYILKGKFYLLEGCIDYRILICFDC